MEKVNNVHFCRGRWGSRLLNILLEHGLYNMWQWFRAFKVVGRQA